MIALRGDVLEKLQTRWSPREIVKRLATEYPAERILHISHEAIYRDRYVLPRGAVKGTLIQALRHTRASWKTRKARRGASINSSRLIRG